MLKARGFRGFFAAESFHSDSSVSQTRLRALVATPATTAATTAKAGHNKTGVLPFHGKLKAIDTTAKTISVGTRTFEITSETIIIKDGKSATLADGVVGDETGGAYKKTDDGKLVLTKLRFGAKVATEPGAAK